jgi:hypothetical protein
VLLPPIALAVAFFAEPGGALATLLAALMIVAANYSRNTPPSGWIPSLLVFLGVAVLLVAFLSIYSARITETSASLRWLLADARAANESLYADRQRELIELRAAEQARDSLLRERARLGEMAAYLATLTQQVAQGDPSAAQTLQTLHPGACGPLAEMASTLTRLSHAPAGSWQIAAIETPMRAQGQALEALDTMARSLCVDANELVVEAQGLEPGASLIGSAEFPRSLWQLEEHLRIQAAHLALLGTQLADIRTTQENLETMLARAAADAKTPPIFAMSDIRPINQHSGPQVTFGSSAIRRAAEVRQAQQAQPPQLSPHRAHGTGRAIRPGNWQSQESLAYNRGV